MILTLATVLSMAAQCAPAAPSQELAAIARTESSFNTLSIHDNTTGLSYNPNSEPEAIAKASDLLARGDSIDVGLMQINSDNLRRYGMSIETALKPCESLKVGAAILAGVSAYNTGDPKAGFDNGYVGKVVRAKVLNRSAKDSTPPAAAPQPAEPGASVPIARPGIWLDVGGEINSAATQVLVRQEKRPAPQEEEGALVQAAKPNGEQN